MQLNSFTQNDLLDDPELDKPIKVIFQIAKVLQKSASRHIIIAFKINHCIQESSTPLGKLSRTFNLPVRMPKDRMR